MQTTDHAPAELTTRDLVLALLSEGHAPGRRGLSRPEIARALRVAAGRVAEGLGELEALAAQGLVVGRCGEWWATVLGHRAGRRVPLPSSAREALRGAVRAIWILAIVCERASLGPPAIIVLAPCDARVILTTALRVRYSDLERDAQAGESLELARAQADELVALGLARWPGTAPEVPS